MKDLAGFKNLIPDVFALWRVLSSQHYIPAAQSARQFIDKMTGTMFYQGWEFQFERHGTVTPPNSGAQLQPKLAEAEDDIVDRLVRLAMEPSRIRLDFAVEACEQFLREMNVDLPAKPSGGQNLANAIPQAPVEESVAEPSRDVPKAPVKPTQFTGGTLVFFEDRVELCEVDICSGRRSKNARSVLDALREKRNGIFVAYDGDELSAKTKLKSGPKGIPGLIKDLRRRISKVLQAEANIICGKNDVIQSGGPGYRFSTQLSVQSADNGSDSPLQGHGGANGGLDDPNQKPENDDDDPNDPNLNDPNDPEQNDPDDPKDAAAARRKWILQQLADGRDLLAPDVVRQFKCSPATAKRDLQALKDEETVEFVGAPSTGTYRLKKRPGQADA